MKFSLSSPVFDAGKAIPAKYSCDGDNISPPLAWAKVLAKTQSLVLILDDPHAPNGTFTHWLVYDIDPESLGLSENFSTNSRHATHGRNDYQHATYDGPCPPTNATHVYHFRLYALNKRLDLTAGATRTQVFEQMQGHLLASVELLATYTRQPATASA